MSFAGDISTFAKETNIKFDKVVRKVTIDMTRELVIATPVDTGLARSSWFFGLTRPTNVGESASKNGAPSISRCLEFTANLKAGGVHFIANNLPYIMALEFGSSTQAPNGMARKTVEKWQEIVNRVAGAL